MTGDKLPMSESKFSEQLKLYFPRVWDMKYIMGKKNIHGGLSKVRSTPTPLSPALLAARFVCIATLHCYKAVCDSLLTSQWQTNC